MYNNYIKQFSFIKECSENFLKIFANKLFSVITAIKLNLLKVRVDELISLNK